MTTVLPPRVVWIANPKFIVAYDATLAPPGSMGVPYGDEITATPRFQKAVQELAKVRDGHLEEHKEYLMSQYEESLFPMLQRRAIMYRQDARKAELQFQQEQLEQKHSMEECFDNFVKIRWNEYWAVRNIVYRQCKEALVCGQTKIKATEGRGEAAAGSDGLQE